MKAIVPMSAADLECVSFVSIEMAIAFVINHPSVTSAIIGPRTIEQLDSQLTAADVTR